MVRKISVRGPALCRMWTGWSWGTKELVMLWMKTVIGPGPFFRWCFWGPNLRGLTFSTRHIQNWTSFLLWRSCFILSGALSNYPPLFLTSKLDTFWPEGAHCPVSYLIACLYCPWDSPGKNTGVGFHFLLQGIFLTQESNPCLSSPALASRFFTTVPHGKPHLSVYTYDIPRPWKQLPVNCTQLSLLISNSTQKAKFPVARGLVPLGLMFGVCIPVVYYSQHPGLTSC